MNQNFNYNNVQTQQNFTPNQHLNNLNSMSQIRQNTQMNQIFNQKNGNQTGVNPKQRAEAFSFNPKKVIYIDQTTYTGKLKFFNELENYGFLIFDIDNSDIFVHYDDFCKAGINNKDFLKSAEVANVIRFSFNKMSYMGKKDKSQKAVNLQLIPNQNFNFF